MSWSFGSKKSKYRILEESNDGEDGYTVYGPGGDWAWYSKIAAETESDALAWFTRREAQKRSLRLNSLVSDLSGYLWAVGWRTLALWFALNSALYSWEPYRAATPLPYFYLQAYQAGDARKQILWLVALSLAQCWIAFELVKMKSNRSTLFVVVAICSYLSIGLVQYSASNLIRAAYGSSSYMLDLHSVNYMFYFGVGLLLLGPWLIWRRRDDFV